MKRQSPFVFLKRWCELESVQCGVIVYCSKRSAVRSLKLKPHWKPISLVQKINAGVSDMFIGESVRIELLFADGQSVVYFDSHHEIRELIIDLSDWPGFDKLQMAKLFGTYEPTPAYTIWTKATN